MKRIILCCLLAAGGWGCASVELVAPHGRNVMLVSTNTQTTVMREWRTWYLLYGLAPIDNTMAEHYIRNEDLTEVYVVVKDVPSDIIYGFYYNFLLPVGIVRQVMEVHGNRQ